MCTARLIPTLAVSCGLLALAAAPAGAQDTTRTSTPATAPVVVPITEEGAEPAPAEASPAPPFVIGGYVEADYQWNFNKPSNGLTNFRGFDNRHNSFSLQNVALDAQWDWQNVVGRLTLQVGHTPSTYYLAEPAQAGSGAANASGPELWKYIQQAYAGYRFDVMQGLIVTGGVILSPIGPEGIAVKDNWNWSRSNLFFGLPFYHTGLKASLAVSDELTLTLYGLNGWNTVVDNNGEKSIAGQVTYTKADLFVLNVLYFTGVERPTAAPEGRAWRHLLDANITISVTPELTLLAHANAGVEPNNSGTSAWVAGALYVRYQVMPVLFLAARGDAFYETVASDENGSAAAIFWPVPWVASGTLTVDYRPAEKVSFRAEYRHDQADGPMFFRGQVEGDGADAPYLPNHKSQDTVTLGVTAWF